ncbi:MAG: hypothetical protein QXQ64_02425 [Candidatus Bathyarchaeia archaeon]|uniref:hypothetical protein n=1 Tax=Candidatus Hadarchaeum sp. TaxID=2883567 RepID=UPI003174EE64
MSVRLAYMKDGKCSDDLDLITETEVLWLWYQATVKVFELAAIRGRINVSLEKIFPGILSKPEEGKL